MLSSPSEDWRHDDVSLMISDVTISGCSISSDHITFILQHYLMLPCIRGNLCLNVASLLGPETTTKQAVN